MMRSIAGITSQQGDDVLPASVVSWSVDTEFASTIGVPFPSGLVSGNTLILLIGSGNSSVVTPPAGFTQRQVLASSFASMVVYTKVSDGSETGDATISFSATRQQVSYMVQVNGAYDTSSAIAVSAATTIDAPQVVAASAGLLISFVTSKDTTAPYTTFTAPGAMTLVDQRIGDSDQQKSAFATEPIAAGATGVRTWSAADGGALRGCNISISNLA